MFLAEHPLLFLVFTTIQLAGLVSLIATRLSERWQSPIRCQLLFYLCLALVGITTVCGHGCGSGNWFSGGATLSIMIVGSTIDLRSAAHRVAL